MSGWIKLEKDLLTDPRLVAAAMELEVRNATPLPAVTLLIGGLARLWMIADTHIGQDDILALNVQQIDKLIGIDGFCEILPRDWLQILDGNRVKLPNYHTHNGSIEKERASNAVRQARHRDRNKWSTVMPSNAVTLPEKKRPRKEKKKKEKERDFEMPIGIDVPSWQLWLQYRDDLGKPVKPASLQAAAVDLAKYGGEQREVVQQSIAAGWQGLFPLKANGSAAHAEPHKTRYDQAREELERAIES